jgi:hypothetical protein
MHYSWDWHYPHVHILPNALSVGKPLLVYIEVVYIEPSIVCHAS